MAYATTALAFSWFLVDWPGRYAAAAGAALGVIASSWLSRSSIRSTVIFFGAAIVLVLSVALRHSVLAQSAFVHSMGSLTAIVVIDSAMFASVCFAVALGLRSLAVRHRWVAALEWIVLVVCFAQLLAAHRHGAINRPFSIADPLLAQGYDPAWALLGVGALVALFGGFLLIREGQWRRMLWHVLALLVVLGGVLTTTQIAGLPTASGGKDSLGLRGKPRSANQKGTGKEQKQRQNDEMEFRDNFDSDMDRSPVAVVLFHDDYSPPQGVYYFRQNTFSQYNGRRLVTATRPDVDLDIASGFPNEPITLPTAAKAGALRKRLDTTMALLADHGRPPALEAPLKLAPSTNKHPARFRRTYRVTSAALNTEYLGLLGAKAGSDKWSPEQRSHYLSNPDDPRYAELVAKILDEMPGELRSDPLARAVAISSWLSRNGIYSLRHGHAKAADPTSDFLFGDRTGYCIHFAHAGAYLMREVGLPTRVATGYAVNEEARQGGSALLLSGADSHAWPEVYYEGVGWVIMDIFPQRSLDKPPPPPDPELQRLMGELLRGQKPLLAEGAPRLPDLKKTAAAILTWLRYGMLALVLGVLGFLYAVKGWRLWSPAFAAAEQQPRVRYRAALDRLAEQGLRRDFGETREAFARRLAHVSPGFAQLSSSHIAARFGEKRGLAPEQIMQQYQEVTRDLRQAIPWVRRAWRGLVPWSWLRSR